MPHIRVISPGFLTTVQDLGRFGYAHLGISAAGAADAVSFRLGNLLVGNPENTPSLEMSLVGAEVEFEEASIVALAGAGMQPIIDGQAVPMWETIMISPGQVLKCGAAVAGVRSYLCIRGGIHVPPVLGSAATHLATGLGGFSGRALRRGDIVTVQSLPVSDSFDPLRLNQNATDRLLARDLLRVTAGPQENLFTDIALEEFYTSSYLVTKDSDRMGLRLEGPAVARKDSSFETLTEGVSLGAVQITHSGHPIILFVDHQTTGGYPKIANVIAADMHRVGQLRSGDRVTFRRATLEEARALLVEQESFIYQHSFAQA
jgi:antagonist of KipI